MPTMRQRLRKKERFIAAFKESGIITQACRASGIARPTVYRWLEKDEKFSAQFAAAIQESTELLEHEAIRRAIDGSDNLMMFMLKARNPEKYRDRYDVRVTDAREEATRIAADLGIEPSELIAEAERIANGK